MTWGNPWILLALVIPLLGAIGVRRLMQQRPQLRWPAMKRVAVSGQRVRPAVPRQMRPAFLVMLAVALAIIAIARPQWGEHTEESFSHTREVMIALDLSRSMLTEDVAPSRLDHAKKVTEDLLNSLKGESVGLVVFAGTAFVQVPLSPDYQIIREFMPSLDTDYMPRGGSDYSRMLDAALEGFSDAPDRDRYLIVLSDGESSTQGWEKRLEDMAKREIHVVSMGLGTAKGAFVPDLQGGYMVDANGDTVHSSLMPATLQALAKRTNGKYIDAATLQDAGDVQAVLAETVETGRKGRISNEANAVRTERFQWFLLPAVILGLVSLSKEFRQRPKPRQVRQDGAAKSASTPAGKAPTRLAAGLVLALAVGAAHEARAHFDSEAEFDVREVFESNPVERLRAITGHLAEFDYDAFDLRLMVEESIKYGVDSQRTGTSVSEGVIRDAIEATRQGERIDESIADWSYYRAQLTAMLEPAAQAAEKDESQNRKAVMDEEDNPPIVVGDSTQQFANDSFGQGASAKTDAALGDLSPGDQDVNPGQRGKKPPPPKNVRSATATRSRSGGGDAEDPILGLTRKRLEEAAKRDSPGRLHQLMAETTPQQDSNQIDW